MPRLHTLVFTYGETSGGRTFPDDCVSLARLDEVARHPRRRGGSHTEVPESDVDVLSSTCLDHPRTRRRALAHEGAPLANRLQGGSKKLSNYQKLSNQKTNNTK